MLYACIVSLSDKEFEDTTLHSVMEFQSNCEFPLGSAVDGSQVHNRMHALVCCRELKWKYASLKLIFFSQLVIFIGKEAVAIQMLYPNEMLSTQLCL